MWPFDRITRTKDSRLNLLILQKDFLEIIFYRNKRTNLWIRHRLGRREWEYSLARSSLVVKNWSEWKDLNPWPSATEQILYQTELHPDLIFLILWRDIRTHFNKYSYLTVKWNEIYLTKYKKVTYVTYKYVMWYAWFLIGIRVISKSRLNTLLCVHLTPINVIISYDPSTNTDLGRGFLLRCFQKLSFPDIATGRSNWRQSPHTRGQFTPVLSY